jgi:imidazole glycerol-phosphate synthase subunit HisH
LAIIHVVDYGIGNILNLVRALQKEGAEVILCNAPALLKGAKAIVIPGVGAFKDCIDGVRHQGFEAPILEHVANDGLLLGICVGMQMLATDSEEFGLHKGLNIIPGSVKRLPASTLSGELLKVPHIGWAAVYANKEESVQWENTPLQCTKEGEFVYFVHSYAFNCVDPRHEITYCIYNGVKITAGVRYKNTIGFQFHPEKSGTAGLRMLKNFVNLVETG